MHYALMASFVVSVDKITKSVATKNQRLFRNSMNIRIAYGTLDKDSNSTLVLSKLLAWSYDEEYDGDISLKNGPK